MMSKIDRQSRKHAKKTATAGRGEAVVDSESHDPRYASAEVSQNGSRAPHGTDNTMSASRKLAIVLALARAIRLLGLKRLARLGMMGVLLAAIGWAVERGVAYQRSSAT